MFFKRIAYREVKIYTVTKIIKNESNYKFDFISNIIRKLSK